MFRFALISDPQQYRDATGLWDAWNVDRMYMAGIPIKMRAHAGLNHEKLVMLYGQHMSIFGSSNWTSSSDDVAGGTQLLLHGPDDVRLVHHDVRSEVEQLDRRDRELPVLAAATEQAGEPQSRKRDGGLSSSVALKWYAGPWAHKYDVLIGIDPNNLTPLVSDKVLGPSTSSSDYKSVTASNLRPGTTYYWRVVGRTMANISKIGDIWSFTTSGTAAPPAVKRINRERRHRPVWLAGPDHRHQVVDRIGRDSCQRQAAVELRCRRCQNHDGLEQPLELRAVHVQRRRRQGVSPVDPRPCREQRLYERFGLCAVLEFGHVDRRRNDAHRDDVVG